MELYHANVRGQEKNRFYPLKKTVKSLSDFKKVVSFDHVAASYKNNQRSVANFIASDVVVLDVDNDYSDNPTDWIQMVGIPSLFPGVQCYAASSRNNKKVKGNQSARPRFHVYFPIHSIQDADDYKALKERIVEVAPYFDINALDSARFIYGVENPEVMYFDGKLTIDDFIANQPLNFEDLAMPGVPQTISQGSRNSTMSQYAGRVLVRLGDAEEARRLFDERASLCEPPLSDEELNQIWQSALKFEKRVAEDPNYIPPDQFNSEYLYQPEDYSDIGQALVLAEHFQDKLRFSQATGFLVYNDSYWEESDLDAVGVVRELTDRQLEEAEEGIAKYKNLLSRNGGMQLLDNLSKKKALEAFNKEQMIFYQKLNEAMNYREFVLKRRNQNYVQATLRIAEHLVAVDPMNLDSDSFILNTPACTYHLETGEVLDHQPGHLLTKQTTVAVKNNKSPIWQEALNTFFLNDQDLIDYVQEIVGLSVVGKVYVEALIIAYGDGRNGKSTFWNTIARVLGTYASTLSADVLTNQSRRNVKPEIAETKGKRLLIAAELQEGMSLNTSIVKQLCSTDIIKGEKKFKKPFDFVPSHTIVLYTNHLPKVGAMDAGTWRRLIVIPFEAVIEGQSDIKNYADYLYDQCGGEILQWIIEGAQRVIKKDFKIKPAKRVQEAIAHYHQANDWFQQFLNECCELGEDKQEKSGQLYDAYRAHCYRTGDIAKNSREFYQALTSAGFKRFKKREGSFIHGLQLLNEFL
ncbi:phage/plasmid primase, P4 family [Hutsoniella sourekii]|uniref:phage/plasmid primase, P4 family n=1 Tax=Hutsoniella sourekii TaxID=87650 RepID=UPI000481EBA3|nr:phage/plasmid primase, P4 family [Hutsoniella sourekii]